MARRIRKKKTAVGAADFKGLLNQILEQQKRQTYLLALIKFDNYEAAAGYVLEKELYLPKKRSLQ